MQASTRVGCAFDADSLDMIKPTFEDIRCGNILKYYCGERVKQKGAQRKLNLIGLVVGHLAIVNSPENMERMQEDLQFASACAEINRRKTANKEAEQQKKNQDLEASAPAAATKLNKEPTNIGKLTK